MYSVTKITPVTEQSSDMVVRAPAGNLLLDYLSNIAQACGEMKLLKQKRKFLSNKIILTLCVCRLLPQINFIRLST